MNLKSMKLILAAPFILIFISGASFGGTLDDFENDATTNRRTEERSNTNQECQTDQECEDDLSDNFCLDIFASIFGSITDSVLTLGSSNTVARTSSHDPNADVTPREPGSPLLPLFRLDGNKQVLNNGVFGDDLRIELGRSLLGAQLRLTNFKETSPPDSLRLTSIHGLYRLSYGNTVGVNLGAGISNLQGNSNATGFSITTPIYWHFHKHFGFEYKPVFSYFNGTNVTDSDASLMFNYHAASLVLGYRTLSSPNETLSGAYLGFSIRK